MKHLLLALVALLGCAPAHAQISGPETSTGTFTLSYSAAYWAPTMEYLADYSANSATTYNPVTFTKAPGVHNFGLYACYIDYMAGISDCYEVDTHTVTVSTSGGPPPAVAPYVVRYGHADGDGLVDVAVTTTAGVIDDFILRNLGGGLFTVITAPTSAQISAARAWPISTATAIVADLTSDGKLDVVIKGLSAVVSQAPNRVAVWSNTASGTTFPTVAASVGSTLQTFFSATGASSSNPNHYANAISQQCIYQSGYYVVQSYVTTPGWYVNQYWQSVYISTPGTYQLIYYLYAGQCFDVVNTSVVQSMAAYVFDERWKVLGGSPADAVFQANAADLYRILESILGAPIGRPESRPPFSDQQKSEAIVLDVWTTISNICDALGVLECAQNVSQEAVALYDVSTNCWTQLLNGSAPLSWNPFIAAKVFHGAGQNFRLTPVQNSLQSGSTDQARLSFWTSRLNDTADPAAPLAIDVVNNAYALGCYANERLKSYATALGISVSLTPVGVSLMQQHAAAVTNDQQGLLGKLSGPQIAVYHHAVFGNLGLPARTFGGTPLSGQPAEAARTKFIWCPSCE